MLAGDLTEFTLPDLFQLLALTKKTGALRVSHGDADGRVYFAEGEVYFAVSDGRRLPLGARLVAGGHLSPDRLQQLLRDHRGDSAVRIAADLVASGEIDDAALDELLRDQIHDALFTLLRLDSGPFEFEGGAGVEWPGARTPAAEALEEAHRRADEWAGLADELPSGDAVLALVPNPPGESPLSLSREQWQLVTLVDGKRTLSEVTQLSGKGEFAGGRLVAELVASGLLEAHDRPGEGGLADLLGARHALRQLEEVALDADSSASSPAASSPAAADAEPEQPGAARNDPDDAAEDAAAEADESGDDAEAPAGADDRPSGHDAPEGPGGVGASSRRGVAAAGSEPGADRPRGQVAVLAPAPSEGGGAAGAELPGLHAGLIEAEMGESAPATDGQRHEPVDAAPEQEVGSDADEAADPAPARTLDRAQVARELAALGLDDAEDAPARPRARAAAAADGGASAQADAEGQRLSRDEDVTRGLLLRLIDGVKGA